ncbi:MAG: hypothetical protein B6D39_08860 [Anaerolineae bacterium UTCFX2]|jgi:hypothetical protein|nr:hypothetical protein [Anaerolineae bacterium]MCZ7552099.1 hypothetical protein [Anaerolineales bacterium]OQY89878.1 MAG: hypothetical protein B6D39_08860 [Anaerolineae bacterium UTCFX2]
MGRWFRFLIAILVGAGAGLAYGWFMQPVKSVDITPATLRMDYKTDYVLMVAEAYEIDKDAALAERRLAVLGETPPQVLVAQAIEFARKVGYSEPDISRMQALQTSLEASSLGGGAPAP